MEGNPGVGTLCAQATPAIPAAQTNANSLFMERDTSNEKLPPIRANDSGGSGKNRVFPP
jgi:hypothetical protein